MKFPQVFQVFELLFVEIFKLKRYKREQNCRLNFVDEASLLCREWRFVDLIHEIQFVSVINVSFNQTQKDNEKALQVHSTGCSVNKP
jgi:hypothetical protein